MEHRAGDHHGNADGLSRKEECTDCKQCRHIEERDGGPQKKEIEDLPLLTASRGDTHRIKTAQKGSLAKAAELAKAQRDSADAVGRIYRLLQEGEVLSPEVEHTEDKELKYLYKQKEAIRF